MKSKFNLNLPNKSIFGFEVLSSIHSSIACYIFLFFGRILSLSFGSSVIQFIAGTLFNFLLNLRILILILNIFIKRKEVKKGNFIMINTILFIYLPVAFYEILINVYRLIIYIYSKFSNSLEILA